MKSMGNKFENSEPKKEAPLFENSVVAMAYEKATQALNRARIKEADFSDLYKEDVRSDIRTTQSKQRDNAVMQTNWDRKNKAIADLLEGLVYQGINSHGWLGENVQSAPAAFFDDYVNGIDQIIRFSYPETSSSSYLGLAIDVTTAELSIVYEKFRKIKKKIDSGELGTLKYFTTQSFMTKTSAGVEEHFHGRKKRVPQAIIGIEPKHVEQLAIDWQENPDSLSRNPVQRLLLMQMRLQMETFAVYAASQGKPDIAEIFSRDEKRLQAILDEKPKKKDEMLELSDDKVFHSIHQALSLFRVPLKSV